MLNRRAFIAASAASFVAAPQVGCDPLREFMGMKNHGNFASRDVAKQWLASDPAFEDGDTFVADGDVYRFRRGATWIPDMRDVVPQTLPSPKHFGFHPDLKWRQLKEGDLDGVNAGVFGPFRDGASNAINGFLLADRFARMAGMGLCQADGDYFVRSYVRKLADGLQEEWPFDFFAEREEDIRVAVYRADVFKALPDDHGLFGSEIAELVHHELEPDEYAVELNPDGLGGVVRFRPEAGRYIDVCHQFDLKSKWSHTGTLWTSFQTFQQGLNLAASGASWDGDRIIGQYSYPASKPSNRGNVGVVAGASTGYYTASKQDKRSDIHLKALLCRAASVKADENDPFVDSDPSILTAAFGWIERPCFQVGTFGRTNTKSNMLFLAHWGGSYVSPAGVEALDKTPYVLTETWHPESVKLEFLSPIDRAGHGFYKGWELASVAGADVGPATHLGVSHPYWVGVGDVSDAFACEDQRGRVNRKPIRIGHQTGIGIAPDPGSEYYGVLYKGTGTSKFEKYPGTEIWLQRHGELNVTCEGHTLEAVPGTLECIRMRQFRGVVDLGECRLTGAKKALYVVGGDGQWRARLQECQGLVHVQNQSRGQLRGAAVGGRQLRSVGPPPEGEGALPGLATVVYAEGQAFTTTVRTSSPKGATELAIHPLVNGWHDINAGDVLQIVNPDGTAFSVTSTGLFVNGAMVVKITALPQDVVEGASVTVDQSAAVTVDGSMKSAVPLWLYTNGGVIQAGVLGPASDIETAYITRAGDALDLICLREYGRQAGAVEAVLADNPHIATIAHSLPAGVAIQLPPKTLPEAAGNEVRLWD